MNETTVAIPETLCDYIESLQFECDARADLIAYLLRSGLKDEEGFQKYHTEFVEYRTKYMLAKQELEDTYIKPLGFAKYHWTLNFSAKEVTVVAG